MNRQDMIEVLIKANVHKMNRNRDVLTVTMMMNDEEIRIHTNKIIYEMYEYDKKTAA